MVSAVVYQRKIFEVEAVLVTEQDLDQIAEWCGGTIKIETGGIGLGAPYIQVVVGRVGGRTQHAFAYAGDWITRNDKGKFHVYRDKVFRATFERTT